MKKIKILQIEDDDGYSEVLRDILDEYDICTVRTKEKALNALKNNNDFDIIICDNNLPCGVLGTELIPEIKKIYNIPIIANSSLCAYCENMVKAGADTYIVILYIY